ncbi:dnaJ homolog subfamily B member 14 isoform X1 [Procambarus clarkii]|uniref:dnaJ homolog subfamily B member 14 isoform X1 n=1 Tax=Procambarus clarkii TaxID=6728 RepID=UPI003743DFD2
MVHDGNKDEAEKCFNLAQKYFQEGNREKAIRFTQKAERLYPSQRSQEFLELLNRLSGTTGHTPHSNGTAGGEGDGGGGGKGGGTGSGENVRQRRTAATGEERTSSSANTTQSSSGTVEFTKEQVDSVKRIMRCKDYYEILGITKEATDSDLKKAYRKLALQFHPDKNKAPGASEAFKAVGNAFAVLSDPEKKKQYDLYGPEESNSPSQNRNSYNHHDFTRGYESDMTAEELFNMFFGGGYPGGNVYVRRGGRWERAGGAGGRSYNSQRGNQHQASHAEQSNLSVFLQLMPLLLILLLSLASSLLSSDPTYSLSPTSSRSQEIFPVWVRPIQYGWRKRLECLRTTPEEENPQDCSSLNPTRPCTKPETRKPKARGGSMPNRRGRTRSIGRNQSRSDSHPKVRIPITKTGQSWGIRGRNLPRALQQPKSSMQHRSCPHLLIMISG